ncbi:hypothetical protein KOEU_35440 [Komagataeibacter europaeus]|uniref:Uncharacterized protein n=1 Tax=Komagataeibacter europaeus TaxID=33995 RepID=A0A0M0ECG6_KOMEU|nr:hypothetical protein [Komagataeibacter europaeus]KON62952.1 hypothetical protein KOEU_35440 [Komagataeibacter europaeus]
MCYFSLRRSYSLAALVFAGGMLVTGMAHADSASEAKRQQLMQQVNEVDKEFQTQQTQLNEQFNQYLKDVGQRFQKLSDWDSDQQYAIGKKCEQLDRQGDTAECQKLQQQHFAEHQQKDQQLTQERQQHQEQYDQQHDELSHQAMLKERALNEQISQLN